MYLIVGLGNPGQKYTDTRHNVGFMLLDYLAGQRSVSFRESRWKAQLVKTAIMDKPVVLLKPETFMNASGTAVAPVANYYKVAAENIIVIHDDLDMDLGRVKIVTGGGDGGHKGARSCIDHLGTRDFPRIKIGIGRPEPPMGPESYVLARFSPEEHELISRRLVLVTDGLNILLQQGIAAAMNTVNQKI